MVHVEKIKIVDNNYPTNKIKKGFEIICESVNLLVGNQGCGKSTLLKLLQENHGDLKLQLSEHVLKNGVNTFYFDTEKDNPRMKDPELYTTPSGQDIGIGFKGALTTRFHSHGEIIESFVIDPLLKAKDSVIFIDEPESGLSITNQFKLISAINKAVKNGCQIFIATHCYPLIENYNVISLEHLEQMSGKEFINKLKDSYG